MIMQHRKLSYLVYDRRQTNRIKIEKNNYTSKTDYLRRYFRNQKKKFFNLYCLTEKNSKSISLQYHVFRKLKTLALYTCFYV